MQTLRSAPVFHIVSCLIIAFALGWSVLPAFAQEVQPPPAFPGSDMLQWAANTFGLPGVFAFVAWQGRSAVANFKGIPVMLDVTVRHINADSTDKKEDP